MGLLFLLLGLGVMGAAFVTTSSDADDYYDDDDDPTDEPETPVTPVDPGVVPPEIVESGTDRSDLIFGTGGDDTIDGLRGNDTLAGRAGDDLLIGGLGNDLLIGGMGNDIVTGNAGDDILIGGPGSDTLDGGWGRDLLLGAEDGRGLFIALTGETPERLQSLSTTQLDTLVETLRDELGPDPDAQMLARFELESRLLRAAADPAVGSEIFSGGPAGSDVLIGNADNDILVGDSGDTLSGGAGNDQFTVFYQPGPSFQPVTITDYNPTTERLELLIPEALAAEPHNSFTNDDGNTIILVSGVPIAELVGVPMEDYIEAFRADRVTFELY